MVYGEDGERAASPFVEGRRGYDGDDPSVGYADSSP